MREVGAFEAKTHLSRLLQEINRDKQGVWITRRGVRLACLLPREEAERNSMEAGKIVEALREVREQQAKSPRVAAKKWIEEGRKR